MHRTPLLQQKNSRHGMAIALVISVCGLLLAIFAGLFFMSRHEVGFVDMSLRRVKAQYIAEAGAALAAAQIFDGTFENRFHAGERQGPHGYVGHMEGDFADGNFYVVCEDIANPIEKPEKEFAQATYNRIDLFARGTYKGVSVVVYKALIRHPEEKVYAYKTRTIEQEDGKKLTETYDIEVR